MHQTADGPTLDWDDVKLFLALCRARTVGDAARAMGIDPSTASRRLASLEEVVDTTLFVRSREGIAPTKAAEDLLAASEAVEQGIARFGNAVDTLERDVSGLVRITCPPDVGDVIVMPVLQQLLGQHPNLRISLDGGESVLDLTRREADIALRIVKPTRGDLVMSKLVTARWVLAAAPTLAKQLGTLKAWKDAPWIGWGERYAGSSAARWLAEHAPKVAPMLCSDGLRTQIAAAAAGVGVLLAPAPSLGQYGLVPVAIHSTLRPDAAAWPADDLYLVTHQALKEVPRIRVVWDALRARSRDLS